MALPSYNKADRRQNFEQLPKGAYVIQIIGAREEANKNSEGTHITIAFDIAEGDYKGFYKPCKYVFVYGVAYGDWYYWKRTG